MTPPVACALFYFFNFVGYRALTSFLRSFPKNYFSFAYSTFAAMRMGMSGSASFHSAKKS